jgi:transcriptional regulator with XRE-family HTH domain
MCTQILRKKINMGSLGERLKQLRQEANLSLEDLSERTKIQAKYLGYLENEEFDKLPSPVYVKGFVRKWADECGADWEDLLLQLHRENKILFSGRDNSKLKPVGISSFVIIPRHIVFVLVVALIIPLGIYLFINHLNSFEDPQIEVLAPLELSSVSDQGAIIIVGRVQNMDSVKINGEAAHLDEEGVFEYSFGLQEGLNTITIEGIGDSGERVEAVRKVLKL